MAGNYKGSGWKGGNSTAPFAQTFGGDSVSSNQRVSQNWLITEQMYAIQKLYSIGFFKRVPEAVRSLFLVTANLHDDQFKYATHKIKRDTVRRADKYFSLKPSDIRYKNENYFRRMEWIRQEYAEQLYAELINLFQRKNLLAKKTYSDSEVDISLEGEEDIG
jgi:hypothetical protein